jgi:hypothetical protein
MVLSSSIDFSGGCELGGLSWAGRCVYVRSIYMYLDTRYVHKKHML